MLLPTIAISINPFVDDSVNQTPIVSIGDNFFSETLPLEFSGGRAFSVNRKPDLTNDFTFEFSGKINSTINCYIFTTSNFNNNIFGELGLAVSNGQIVLVKTINGGFEILATLPIASNLQNTDLVITLTKSDSAVNVYLNQNLLVTANIGTHSQYTGYIFLGRLTSDKRQVIQGYSGTVNFVKLHDGFSLPVSLFSSHISREDRSQALSKITNYVFNPRDLTTKICTDLVITDGCFFVKFNDGSIFAIYRQRMTTPTVLINNFTLKGAAANELWVTLSNGVELLAGNQQSFTSSENADFPLGSGYLITDADIKKFVPLNVLGDGTLKEETNRILLSTNLITPLSYDENTVIILQERVGNSQAIQPVGAANTWVTRNYQITAGAGAEYDVTVAGNLILPAGVYQIVGNHIGQSTRTIARVFDVTNNSTVATSTVGISVTTPINKYFNSNYSVINPIEIAIQTLNETATTALNEIARLLNNSSVYSTIKIYRIE